MTRRDRAVALSILALAQSQPMCAGPAGAQATRAETENRLKSRASGRLKTIEAAPRSGAPAPPPHLSLCGTVVYSGAGRAIAYLLIEGSAKPISVGLGADVAGWIVTDIADKQLVLSRDGNALTYTLNYTLAGNETPTAAVATQPSYKPPAAAQGRTRRVVERNVSGVLRSHWAKRPPSNTD